MVTEADLGAMNALGIYYKNVEQNYNKSFDLIKRSSDLGNIDAACNLANFYKTGQYVVEKDLHEAYKLFKTAANKGNPIALYNIGVCLHYGRGVETDLKLATEFYKKVLIHIIQKR
jgi:TPR repeat protein